MDEGTNIVMINSAGQVLLYLRDDKPTIKFPNTWCLPGGYVEQGEQPHECIRREIEEEMGVVLEEVRPLVSATRSYGVEHTFWTEIDLDLDHVVLTEGQRLKWFTRAEIDATPLGYEDNAILADFFARRDHA
ncbi:8-oxo-dGTP diphosphatase [Lentzea atacamensis]|uniref:8-oxo-dGTP diphosphatase n=1 Tax=Lentzea atacamensis TaxID=531938 RepID=A0A316I562_9PSEU|nr:NUDIX domain-containing protein [Lentzea atacamensis]PWK88405.1 8-oxo-dGTP diphosphatase [Lentzea atacamensis]RAS70862.1 8-oxo-dGTP diphosphatase [Lentzea atacamensis]